MTQIIFQVAAIGCCIYTAYRLGLFIYKKLRKNNKTAKAVQVTSYETSDRINPAIEPARSFSSVIEEYADSLPKENSEKVSLQEGTYDKEKFVATLKGKGIDTVLRYTEEGRIYGTTFIDHRTGCVLNGSRMGKELSANALQEHFTLPYAGQPPISLSVPVEEPENRQGYSDSKNVMLWYIIDV